VKILRESNRHINADGRYRYAIAHAVIVPDIMHGSDAPSINTVPLAIRTFAESAIDALHALRLQATVDTPYGIVPTHEEDARWAREENLARARPISKPCSAPSTARCPSASREKSVRWHAE